MIKKEPYIGMPIDLGEYDKPPKEPDKVKLQGTEPAKPTEGDIHAEKGIVVGMAYVPWQNWKKIYDYEKAFMTGTIFPDLNLPFKGYTGGGAR